LILDQQNKKALIFGISGQDGFYLANFLNKKKNYIIHGTSRNAFKNSFNNLKQLKIFNDIELHSVNPADKNNVKNIIKKIKPDEIYNLSGQSSVSKSFLYPQETFNSITQASINILEAIKLLDLDCKFYNAGSSECFGDTGDIPSNETTKFNPCSPYGVAKSSAFWLTKNYRDTHNIFACSGILFNHESPLRPDKFVTKKIIRAAVRIYLGEKITLTLGDLSIKRDWGWAPDYVEAMWLILQHNKPEDFVVSTGILSSLEFFVENVFSFLNLDWENYTEINKNLFRPNELKSSVGDSKKAKTLLNWEANYKIKEVIGQMVIFELKKNEKKI
jgi:GDPmannose 4,6-dehydratase